MKKALLAALATLMLVTACKKDDTSTPAVIIMQVTGALAGANQVPAVTTSASGSFTGTYNKSTMVLTYSVDYNGFTPKSGHLHLGAPGTAPANNIFVVFTNVATSPITGTATLNQLQADALLAGNVYANLHSVANPGGEIRANLAAK